MKKWQILEMKDLLEYEKDHWIQIAKLILVAGYQARLKKKGCLWGQKSFKDKKIKSTSHENLITLNSTKILSCPSSDRNHNNNCLQCFQRGITLGYQLRSDIEKSE